MRASSTATDDSASGLIPAIVCAQPDDVIEVRSEAEFRLFVRFSDGTSGTVEMSDLVRSPKAGVFASLRDAQLFQQVYVEYGAVAWPGGIDLAPDAMYAALRSDGRWVLA